MLRLNLGAGDDRRDGYLSVDLRDEVADICCDVRELPWGDEEVDEILALDLLEHFPADQTQKVLGEWRRVLKPGGRLTVKVPNLHVLSQMIVNGVAVAGVIRNIYGGHRWGPDGAWDAHHAGWTPDLLAVELDLAGFDVVSNDCVANMTVVAVRR